MDSRNSIQTLNLGPVLVLLFVNRRVIVHRLEPIYFHLGQAILVILAEDADFLFAANLEQHAAFSVDVIGRHSVWRSHENNSDPFLDLLPHRRVDEGQTRI
jgi:hypothetical protein